MVAASEQVAAIRQEQKYRVFRLAGRPIIATPASPLLLRLAGLSQYRPLTKKRSLLRAALRIAAVGGVDGLFARTSLTPFTPAEDFGFQQWLNKIRRTLRMPSVTATVIWPQLIRRKRVYVHLMAPSGAPVAFCKISLDSANADRLKNEIEALTALRETGRLSLTRVPQILHQDVISGYRYVVYEPFPLDLVPLKHSWDALAPCVTEISGNIRRLDRAGLEQCDWWQRFVRGRGRHLPEFLQQVDEAVARPMAVCRVQGDATPSNIFRSRDSIWICDWEFSSPTAPHRTDELSYYLAANHYQCLIRPDATLVACFQRFAGDRDRDSIGELVLALAFLCGRSDPRALKIVRHWRSLSHVRAPRIEPAALGAFPEHSLGHQPIGLVRRCTERDIFRRGGSDH